MVGAQQTQGVRVTLQKTLFYLFGVVTTSKQRRFNVLCGMGAFIVFYLMGVQGKRTKKYFTPVLLTFIKKS